MKSIDYASYSGNSVAYYTAVVNVDTSSTADIYPGMQAKEKKSADVDTVTGATITSKAFIEALTNALEKIGK